MKRKIMSLALAAVLCLSMAGSAFAAGRTEQEAAADYVREQGIMVGDQNGDLNLDSSLNRAELAVLLTRLHGGEDKLAANTAYYERGCQFTDVPRWATPYVGYCVRNNLVAGYDRLHYGAADPVTPAAACTVMLRVRDIADAGGSYWSYSTAVSCAASLGWIDQPTASATTISRGEMAVLIYRVLTGSRPVDPQSIGTGDGYLTNGRPVTEENVLELLRQIEKDWPSGTVWGTRKVPGTYKNEVPSTVANRITDAYWVSGVYACGGYANMVSSLIFGDTANPARQVTDLSQIRPGDVLFLIRNDTGKVWHVMVAIESPNEMNAVHYTDGNHGAVVYWPDSGSPYSRECLDCYGTEAEGKTYRLEAWTRYPGNVPYSGRSVNAWGVPTLAGAS